MDCSSVESIVRDVIKPGMDGQEKLLALYQWFRRTIYHYRMMSEDRRDVLRLINTYGYALCGSQAAVFRQLCNAAGFKARVVSGDGGNELGHTVVEVWYGGCWHVIDTMTSFYVLTRETRPVIASMADLAADPTLVAKAQEERRCGPEFLYCLRQQRPGDYTLRQKMSPTGCGRILPGRSSPSPPMKKGLLKTSGHFGSGVLIMRLTETRRTPTVRVVNRASSTSH